MHNKKLIQDTIFVLYNAEGEPIAYDTNFLFTCKDENIDEEEH